MANNHFTSETIAQIVALHAVGHQTKEIMDLMGQNINEKKGETKV